MTGLATGALFVPSERLRPGDREARLVLHDDPGLGLLVLAYSRLAALVDVHGHQQPWVALPDAVVRQLRHELDAGLVIDGVLAVPAGRPSPPAG